jgi:hypothetical protein
MSRTPQQRARAKLARFAARLGVLDLSALGTEVLDGFSDADLGAAATAAGWTPGDPPNRARLLALVRSNLERLEQPEALPRPAPKRPPERQRKGRRSYRVRAVAPEPAVPPAPPAEPAPPWGYGIDRVRAMVVDPDRLFVYWEVTDEAIARARQALGSGGRGAVLVLRVYDTTGRIFDGTNAHHHFDHEIARTDRQWFFHIGRPESEACVELGLRSQEGDFARIARSGRVEFPRRGPVRPRHPRWLTVRVRNGHTASVEPVPVGGATHASSGRAAWQATGGAPAGPPGGGAPPIAAGGDRRIEEFPFDPVTFATGPLFVERFAEETRVLRWEGAGTWDAWEAGPFTHEIEPPPPLTERFVGGMRVYRTGPRTRVVYGPWEVVIRGISAYRRRSVLARWEIQRSWVSEEGREVRDSLPVDGELLAGSSARPGPGASERRWLAGSELRLRGASEVHWMGASERRLGGASERLYQAASERMLRGASERRYRGASERLLRGASERLLRGASERLARGASERLLRGASERLLRGASERRVGGATDDRSAPTGQTGYPRPPREPDSGR